MDDWEDRYATVIDMGKSLPDMDPALKVPATKVEGCASQVWLHPEITDGKFSFAGDSDAMIVKGLIAVLSALYTDQRVRGRKDRRLRRTSPPWPERGPVLATLQRAARDGRTDSPIRVGSGLILFFLSQVSRGSKASWKLSGGQFRLRTGGAQAAGAGGRAPQAHAVSPPSAAARSPYPVKRRS